MTENDSAVQFEAIHKLEGDLGLRVGFCEAILKEDDWSFIVKLHALLEAAISHLLTETLCIATQGYDADQVDKSALSKHFAWVELSDKRRGKTSLAHSLGLLFETEVRFINHLSELRNTLLHDVRNTSFSLNAHIASLDRQQSDKFIASFGHSVKSDEKLSAAFGKPVSRTKFVLENPKLCIWLSALVCLEDVHNSISICTHKSNIRRLEKEKLQILEPFIPIFQAASTIIAQVDASK